MTETFQWPKYLSKKWPNFLSEKRGCCRKLTIIYVNLNNAPQLRLKSADAFIVYTRQDW